MRICESVPTFDQVTCVGPGLHCIIIIFIGKIKDQRIKA